VVTLEQDIREEDAELVINALKMVKGVVGVEPVEASAETLLAETRARVDLHNRLIAALQRRDRDGG